MKTRSFRYRFHGLLSVLLLLILPTVGMAEVYDFEVLIFERPSGGTSEYWPPEPGEPDLTAAVGRLSAAGGSGGATMLTAKRLGPAAYTLKKKGMVIHEHLAWRQATRGRGSNTWYRIGGGRLDGLIRMSQGRYLHLDTDLVLRDGTSSQPYRIKLHRRMRSNELHYVDHPKLGILVRAKRFQADAPSDGSADSSSGEPKPAEPLPTGKPG